MRISEQDRIAVPVPLYHCFGCVIGTLVAVVSGATMILPAATFDALATLAGYSRRARDGGLWSADDVYRGAGASGFPTFDLARCARE
jgi:fatty-acyl-CoA synthase